MTSRAQIEIAKQAIAELYHCVEADARWFTKGRSGQMQHAHEWSRRGMEAIAALEKELA